MCPVIEGEEYLGDTFRIHINLRILKPTINWLYKNPSSLLHYLVEHEENPPFWHLNLLFFSKLPMFWANVQKKTFDMVHHPHHIFIVIWQFPKKHISLNAKTVSLSMFTMIRWFQNYLKPSFDNEVLRKTKDPGLWSFVKFGFGRTKKAKQYAKHGAKTWSFLHKGILSHIP